MRVIVYAERTISYEIEVEPDEQNTVGEAMRIARAAIDDEATEGVLSFYHSEGSLDLDVEVLS